MSFKLKHEVKQIVKQLNLTEGDSILIDLFYNMEEKANIDKLLSDKMNTIVEAQVEFKIARRMMQDIAEIIWDKGSIQLVKAIANQDKINIGFLNNQFEVLPKTMLPNLSSFDKISSTNPKAGVAKQLGATIVV
jgi:predicted regulator of amino acid metabolism with ACT domain